MMSTHQHREQGFGIVAILLSLLILLPCTWAWSQAKGQQPEDIRQKRAAKGLAVVVQDGRLSVDVQQADLAEILAQISRQANIRMVLGPSAGKRVSAGFTGVELEEGIRRLLRLASLSHLFLHAQGPAGTVVLSEVRVLGEGTDTSARPATIAEPSVPVDEPNPAALGRTGRRQTRSGAVRPVESAEGEAPEPVQEVVESVEEATPDPAQEEPTEITRRIREVFSTGYQMKAKPPGGQESSPDKPTPPNHDPDSTGGTSR